MYFHKDKKDEERPVLLTQGKNIRKTAKQVGLGLHSWLHIKGVLEALRRRQGMGIVLAV
jgi:hypothetical protein